MKVENDFDVLRINYWKYDVKNDVKNELVMFIAIGTALDYFNIILLLFYFGEDIIWIITWTWFWTCFDFLV